MAEKAEDYRRQLVSREVVELIADQLARGAHKGDCKRTIREIAKRDKISRQVYETILARARALNALRRRGGIPKMKTDAIEFYQSVARDEDCKMADRLRAQERLDEISGIGAKYTGNKQEADAETVAAEIRKLVEEAEASVEGPDDPLKGRMNGSDN